MWQKINNTCDFLKSRTALRPKVAIILGTGLGDLAKNIEVADKIPYSEIPNFKTSTVAGHQGCLLFGYLEGVQIMAMQGRLHYYEGYSMSEITFPERVMKVFGIETLIVSNAAGGLNPEFVPGDIMFITDHLNMFPEHPLRGPNIEELGTRFPDMGDAYNKKLIAKAEEIAAKHNIPYKKGVYVGTQGPSFETLAEYRYFHKIGGDTVGMSTVPEVIVAHHAGIKCFGISIVANVGLDANINEVSHDEVQENTKKAQANLSVLIKDLIKFC